jgi:hypothetical protein
MSDPLCVCGHRASIHATPDSGDTRCLAVEAREDLISVFDDGRDSAYGYCACLRFTEGQPDPEGVAMAQTGRHPRRRADRVPGPFRCPLRARAALHGLDCERSPRAAGRARRGPGRVLPLRLVWNVKRSCER